jgi:hypothetical protein
LRLLELRITDVQEITNNQQDIKFKGVDLSEKITLEFFKRRFPDKDIEFEKKCGYFGEWVQRFKSGEPEMFMDTESLEVWEKMKEEKRNGI